MGTAACEGDADLGASGIVVGAAVTGNALSGLVAKTGAAVGTGCTERAAGMGAEGDGGTGLEGDAIISTIKAGADGNAVGAVTDGVEWASHTIAPTCAKATPANALQETRDTANSILNYGNYTNYKKAKNE